MIIIPAELKKMINAEAEKAYPNECCGIIFGNTGRAEKTATAIEPISNSFDDSEQYHRFLITPEAMLKAELRARTLKLGILGFYHSHPDCPAEPSDYDREHALPFYSYVIVSVSNGTAKDFASWELREDRSSFNCESIR